MVLEKASTSLSQFVAAGYPDPLGAGIMSILDDVYRKFGETAEAAQLLETQLGNLLLFIEGAEENLFDQQNKELAQRIVNKINKSTLGSLLKKIEEKMGGVAATSILENALNERNRLSHSFYREHNFRRNSPDGCKIMLQDLEKIHEIILEAYVFSLALSGTDIESLELPLPKNHVQI